MNKITYRFTPQIGFCVHYGFLWWTIDLPFVEIRIRRD